MGMCNNCGKQINLKGDDKFCPYCGQLPYNCWNCHEPLNSVEDNECPICHWYICSDPNCDKCGPSCKSYELAEKFKVPVTMIREIASCVYKKHALYLCPLNVPKSYATNRLNMFVDRITIQSNRGELDRTLFKERFNKILNEYPIGKKWTVDQIRNDGEYGQEMRDASNYAICMGIVSVQFKKKEDSDKRYFLFEKVSNTLKLCGFCHPEQEIKKKCPKCKMVYSSDFIGCPSCQYKKGDKKGQSYNLKDIKSKVTFCQLPRGTFSLRSMVKDGHF